MDRLDPQHIRNFSVIAHIDHGKSTLADRFLEFTGALQAREMEAQVLDTMDLERERGITIKAHPVRLNYKAKDGEQYVLNLIDTPGHVDFSYEVTRSLAACEGALLLVDASQGVEAQTLANAYLAVDSNLEIIPVINKIDLPGAQPEETRRQIEDIIGLPADGAILASAKEGIGTEEILEAIVARLPPPTGDPAAPLKALIFDSWYDSYRGVIIVVRMLEGTLRPGLKVRFMASAQEYPVESIGVFLPKAAPVEELGPGEVGFLTANIKNVRDAQIGDTVTEAARQTAQPFPGFKELRPMVFAGLYPVEGHEYPELREALDKLKLNDSSLFFEPETSVALGFGFRCGFLGLLHMEIVQERLEREFDMDLVTTAPGVLYRVTTTDGEVHEIDSPAKLPDPGRITKLEEPVITATIITPSEFVGGILQLCQDKRGVQKSLEYLTSDRVLITLRAAVRRSGAGLLRQAEDAVARLRVARLPRHRLLGVAARQDGYSGERRRGGRAVAHPPPRVGVRARQGAGVEDARADPAPDVRSGDPGRHRHADHRPRIGEGAAEERAREVLRWRHLAQAQAAREAERRQEAHEARRPGGDPAGGVPGGAQDRGVGPSFSSANRGRTKVRPTSVIQMSSNQKSTLREYFESIVIAVILALFIRTFVVQAFKIPTGSMENNLLVGDHLLVNKFIFGPSESAFERTVLPEATIRRGDVVVFKFPKEPERDFIKRVIGLPGETLEMREKKIYINGNPLDEPYVHYLLPPRSHDQEFASFDKREQYGPVTIPDGQYFVMGDNRDNSEDSRYWGYLKRDYIKGKALMVYWSYESDREDYEQDGLGATLTDAVSVVTHFFTRTRWDRLLHQIR